MTIYSLTEIEDSKGYVGEGGRLLSTNLRVIWHLEHRKKSNLCKFGIHGIQVYRISLSQLVS